MNLDHSEIKSGTTHSGTDVHCTEAPQVSVLQLESVVVMEALLSKSK